MIKNRVVVFNEPPTWPQHVFFASKIPQGTRFTRVEGTDYYVSEDGSIKLPADFVELGKDIFKEVSYTIVETIKDAENVVLPQYVYYDYPQPTGKEIDEVCLMLPDLATAYKLEVLTKILVVCKAINKGIPEKASKFTIFKRLSLYPTDIPLGEFEVIPLHDNASGTLILLNSYEAAQYLIANFSNLLKYYFA